MRLFTAKSALAMQFMILFQVLATFCPPAFSQPAPDMYLPDLPVSCRKLVDGEWQNFIVHIDLKVLPNDQDGFGTGVRYQINRDPAYSNCNGVAIAHFKYDIVSTWIATGTVQGSGGTGIPVTVGHAENKLYWDNYYLGYNAPTACDYTQNCHGFAFGIGRWPFDAVEIMGVGVTQFPEDPANWATNACYESTTEDKATIATDIMNHSIKVVGLLCPGQQSGPPKGGDDQTGAPPPFAIIARSDEQMRESGVYWRTGTCQEPVNLNLAHARYGGEAFPEGYSFLYVKPK